MCRRTDDVERPYRPHSAVPETVCIAVSALDLPGRHGATLRCKLCCAVSESQWYESGATFETVRQLYGHLGAIRGVRPWRA